MTGVQTCALPILSALELAVAAQAPPKPAFVITLNGDGFAMKELTFAPMAATYANNVWRSSRDPRIDRIELIGLAERGSYQLQIGVPPVVGTFAFDKSDEDKADRNPYLNFLLKIENPKDSTTRAYKAEHVDVVVTTLDPIGGRIAGSVRGTIRDGGDPVTLSGTFSIVRGRDRVVD